LGSNSNSATLLYTGTGQTSNRAFSLAAGGTGVFQISSSLNLSGPIGGNGSLTKTGSGMLTLSGSNFYTGSTTVSSGTLAVSSSGSINDTSGITVTQGCLLQVSGGSSGQLPDSGNITLNGGNLNYLANVSAGTAGELTGTLLLNPGQSSVTASNSGNGLSYLRFVSGAPSAVVGATVNFAVSSTSALIQFQSNPPGGNGSIIGGYAYYNNVDFAALTATGSGSPYTVSACSYTGGDLAYSGTAANAEPTGTQTSLSTAKQINSLNLTGTTGVTMTGTGSLVLNSGGLICNTTSAGNISGGTLKGSASSELTINTVQDLSIGSVIADNGGPTALVKTGSGTLTLTGSNTFTGNTYLNQGTLAYNVSNNLTYVGAINGIGGLTKSGGAVLTLNGTNTYTGPTTISQGNLTVNGVLAAGSTVTVGSSGVLSGSGTIGGSVLLNGSTINLSNGGTICGASTATGGYWLGAGSVDGLFSVPSGTLTIGSTSATANLTASGGLSIAGPASLSFATSAATLTGSLSYASSTNTTLSGIIAGPGSIVTLDNAATKLGLSGNNTYGGGTVVSAGTLQADSAAALGSGGLSIGSQGVFDLNAQNCTFTSLSGSTGGVLTDSSTATGTTTVTMSSGSSVATNYSGTICNGSSRTLSLVMSGSGALTLSGTNSYTGGTTVSGGTLSLGGALALSSTGVLTVSSNQPIDLSCLLSGGPMQWASDPAPVPVVLSDIQSSPASVPNMATLGGAPALSQDGAGSAVGGLTAGPAAVPEPGTLVLALAAIIGLGLFQVRRRVRG
jgi:autotransporter-associated beta strand protein